MPVKGATIKPIPASSLYDQYFHTSETELPNFGHLHLYPINQKKLFYSRSGMNIKPNALCLILFCTTYRSLHSMKVLTFGKTQNKFGFSLTYSYLFIRKGYTLKNKIEKFRLSF